jgi:putative DNA primase/helicase
MPNKQDNPKNVYDRLGGNVEEEARQYPIEKLDLLTTENAGKLAYNRCTENVCRILDRHPEFKGRFRFDKWTDKHEIREGEKWREVDDADFVAIQRRISTMYPQFRTIGKEMVIDAVFGTCREHGFDRAEEFVKGLEWDGVPRLDAWLHTVYGTPDDEYHKAVGANFFKGMVKRILHPGCKFDSVMILEGKQGCGKSTSFSIIAGDWHLETTMRADSKDFFLQFKGKLIVEFSEGETLSRTETKNMKAMISTQVDTYRAPYGRTMRDIPRRCVFAMTTNQDEYLKDDSGNRRFFPVEVEKEHADLKWLRENREQLFAEALHRVETLKESIHEYPADARKRQESKMVRSAFEEAIAEWMLRPVINGSVSDLADGVTIAEIWRFALLGDSNRMNKNTEMQIALALKGLGWEKQRKMIDGSQKTRWFKSGE